MKTLITGAQIWDASMEARRSAEVLIAGERIEAIVSSREALPRQDATVIDGTGLTVMPGLVDVHSHMSFPSATYPNQIEDTPPEETLMAAIHNAKAMLDMGFTLLIGAGAPKFRSEVVVRNEVDAGRLPGPRILASTPTLAPTGGLNDFRPLFHDRPIAALIVDSPDEVRRAVRLGYREGVDVVKINASGDGFFQRPDMRTTMMHDDEVAMAIGTAHKLGLRVAAHARSAESIKMMVRHGCDIVHHADFADAEGLDMLEAAKDRLVMGPTIGYLHTLRYEAEAFGISPAVRAGMKLDENLACNIETFRTLHKRGLKLAIGGDYAFPWAPMVTTARDIEFMIQYYGMTAVEALRCATVNGATAAGRDHELGLIKPGYYADILLVDGDPTSDVKLLQDKANLAGIMKGGQFHKTPGPRGSRRVSTAA